MALTPQERTLAEQLNGFINHGQALNVGHVDGLIARGLLDVVDQPTAGPPYLHLTDQGAQLIAAL